MSKKAIQISGEIATETTKAIITSGVGLVLAAILPETIPFWLTALGITGKVTLNVIGEKIKEKFCYKKDFFDGINEIYNNEIKTVLRKGTLGQDGFEAKYEHFKRYYDLCNTKSDEIYQKYSNEDGILNYLSSNTARQVINYYFSDKNINEDFVIEVANEITTTAIHNIKKNTNSIH